MPCDSSLALEVALDRLRQAQEEKQTLLRLAREWKCVADTAIAELHAALSAEERHS